MATWGTLTWNTGDWGLQNDSTVSVNGIGASSNLGTVDSTSTVEFGWGRDLWSSRAWGAPDQIVLLGSFALTSSLGDETADGEINAGWGRLTWGENAWGEQGDVVLSGISMSASLGDEAISIDVSQVPTSLPMTASQGDESIEISFEIELTGFGATANLGIADAGPDAMLEGIGGTASVGSVEAYNLEGWGRYFYGQFEWGATGEWEQVDLTGVALSANVGTLDITGTADIDVTGEEMTAEEGTVDPAPDAMVTGVGMTITSGVGTVTAFANIDMTGVQANFTIGNETVSAEANVGVTGSQLTGSLGQLEYEAKYLIGSAEATSIVGNVFGGELVEVQVTTASAQPWGEVAWGDGQWGQSVGTDIGIGGEEVAVPSVEVDVTGIELSSNTGNEAVTADSNLSLTGIGLDLQLGDEDAFTNVRINVSGNDVGTIVIGDYLAGISAEAQPSGVTMTSSSGTIGLNAWELVDPGTAPTWTVVDKAA